MKTLFLSLLILGSAAVSFAQPSTPRFESMKIHAENLPRFPITLVAQGVTEGLVRVAAKVGPTATLEDHLVVAYTHPTLAAAAIEALKRFRFTPARLNGEPITAQSLVDFHFKADGVVINQNMTEHFLAQISGRTDPELVYAPCSLRELDRIPTPIHVISPYYDAQMEANGLKGDVTIDFYIDEKGQVRMPVVGAGEQQELASLALAAVREWTFEPPTRRGRPVLVQARQRFHFGSNRAVAVADEGNR